MIYLVISPQTIQIKSQTNKILKEVLGDDYSDFSVSRIDGTQEELDNIIMEMSQLPFGSDKRCVVVENPIFLTNNKIAFDSPRQESELTELIKRPIDEINVIFTIETAALNKKSKFYTLIEQNKGKIFDCLDIPKEKMPEYIEKYVEKRESSIDHNAAVELAKRINGDLNILVNECAKLLLYTDHIKLTDVLMMVNKPLEDNVFAISNALLKGENMLAYDIYLDLKVANVEPITLIGMLANQFRFVSQVQYLNIDRGMSIEEMAKKMQTSDVRVKIALQNARKFTPMMLQDILLRLSYLDRDIKSGSIDRFYAFELFLINFKV